MKRLTNSDLFVSIPVILIFGALQLFYCVIVRTGDRGWSEGPSEAVIAPYNEMDQIVITISVGIFLFAISLVLLNGSILVGNVLKSWWKPPLCDGISFNLYMKIMVVAYLIIQSLVFF